MKLYVAGPMTGYENYNYDAFHRAAETLRQMGHVVICPAESFGGDQTHAMTDYARFDVHALLQVEGVVLLPGWMHSDGAKREVVIAQWLGLPFYLLDRDVRFLSNIVVAGWYHILEVIHPKVTLTAGVTT